LATKNLATGSLWARLIGSAQWALAAPMLPNDATATRRPLPALHTGGAVFVDSPKAKAIAIGR